MRNTIVPFFGAVALIALLQWAARPSRATAIVAGVVTSVAALYTYQPLKLLPVLAIAWLLWLRRVDRDRYDRLRSGVVPFAIAFLIVAVPMIAVAITDPTNYFGRAAEVSALNPDVVSRDWIPTHLLKTFGMFGFFGDGNGRHNVSFLPLLPLPLVGLAALGVRRLWLDRRDAARSLILLSLPIFMIPPVIATEGYSPHFLRVLGMAAPLAVAIGIGAGEFVGWARGFDSFGRFGGLGRFRGRPAGTAAIAAVALTLALVAGWSGYVYLDRSTADQYEPYRLDIVAAGQYAHDHPNSAVVIDSFSSWNIESDVLARPTGAVPARRPHRGPGRVQDDHRPEPGRPRRQPGTRNGRSCGADRVGSDRQAIGLGRYAVTGSAGRRPGYGQALAVITFAGAALRILLAARQGLGFDEDFTAVAVSHPIDETLRIVSRDSAPPLFYVLEHAASTIGAGPWNLRLVPIAAGIALIPLLAALARRVAGDGAGLWAAALAAFLPAALFTATNARMYGLAGTLVVAAALALWRALERPNALRWAGFGLAACAALWTEYFAAAALAGILVAALWLRPSQRTYLTACLVLAAAAATLAPWFVYASGQFGYASQGFWVAPLSLGGVAGTAGRALRRAAEPGRRAALLLPARGAGCRRDRRIGGARCALASEGAGWTRTTPGRRPSACWPAAASRCWPPSASGGRYSRRDTPGSCGCRSSHWPGRGSPWSHDGSPRSWSRPSRWPD